MDIQEINQSSPEFLYQMLGRLEAMSEQQINDFAEQMLVV